MKVDFLKRTWAEISLDNLVHNYHEIESKLAESSQIMAVVKADGYGHSDAIIAKTLSDEGANWFGVSNMEEALSIRRTVLDKNILIFGYTPPNVVSIIDREKITQTVFSLDYAKELSKEAGLAGVEVSCHLKIDTGMNRIGITSFETSKAVLECEEILALPSLIFSGIFTHFASADDHREDEFTRIQFDKFMEIVGILEKKGHHFEIKHACNSAGFTRFKDMHLDMVRPGVILYGVMPSREMIGLLDIKPVMTLKTVVTQVKEIPGNTSVSYGRKYFTDKTTKIATVPIGYADGYERRLSCQADMLIFGNRCRVVGNICMDQLMLDVTGLDVKPGDEVVVIGRSGDDFISAMELGDLVGTLHYEVICSLGKRVPRVYIKDEEQVSVTRYKYLKYYDEE